MHPKFHKTKDNLCDPQRFSIAGFTLNTKTNVSKYRIFSFISRNCTKRNMRIPCKR